MGNLKYSIKKENVDFYLLGRKVKVYYWYLMNKLFIHGAVQEKI